MMFTEDPWAYKWCPSVTKFLKRYLFHCDGGGYFVVQHQVGALDLLQYITILLIYGRGGRTN